MSYNPFKTELRQLESRLEHAQHERARLVQQCVEYDTFDVSDPPPFVDALSEGIPDLEDRVRRAASNLQATDRQVRYLSQQAALGFDPRRWFDADRRAAAKELDRGREERARLSRNHQDLQEQLRQVLLDRTRLLQEDAQLREQHAAAVAAHAQYDRAAAEASITALTADIEALKDRISPLLSRSEAMDAELAPHLAELSVATRERDQARRREQRARWYDEQLSRADTKREKAEIHQQCEAELGDGSPSRVLSRALGVLESVNRRIAKIEERVRVIAERASRHIDLVVIDGNNLCYPKRGRFSGVGALRAIVQSGSISARIVVVFDASIRKHGFNESSLARAIGGNVRVHIVNGAADETVLDLASGSNEYVVSNDRFDDYRDKPAVAQRRVFRHEHVGGRVLVHDLKVDARYG